MKNSKDTSKKPEPNLLSNGASLDRYINLTGDSGAKPGMIDLITARSKVGKSIFLNTEGDHGSEFDAKLPEHE